MHFIDEVQVIDCFFVLIKVAIFNKIINMVNASIQNSSEKMSIFILAAASFIEDLLDIESNQNFNKIIIAILKICNKGDLSPNI